MTENTHNWQLQDTHTHTHTRENYYICIRASREYAAKGNSASALRLLIQPWWVSGSSSLHAWHVRHLLGRCSRQSGATLQARAPALRSGWRSMPFCLKGASHWHLGGWYFKISRKIYVMKPWIILHVQHNPTYNEGLHMLESRQAGQKRTMKLWK